MRRGKARARSRALPSAPPFALTAQWGGVSHNYDNLPNGIFWYIWQKKTAEL